MFSDTIASFVLLFVWFLKIVVNFQVKVTEIFDVTDSDSPIVQTKEEKDVNEGLEFDDDWGGADWGSDNGKLPILI